MREQEENSYTPQIVRRFTAISLARKFHRSLLFFLIKIINRRSSDIHLILRCTSWRSYRLLNSRIRFIFKTDWAFPARWFSLSLACHCVPRRDPHSSKLHQLKRSESSSWDSMTHRLYRTFHDFQRKSRSTSWDQRDEIRRRMKTYNDQKTQQCVLFTLKILRHSFITSWRFWESCILIEICLNFHQLTLCIQRVRHLLFENFINAECKETNKIKFLNEQRKTICVNQDAAIFDH